MQAKQGISYKYLGLFLGAIAVSVLPLLFDTRYATNLLVLAAAWGVSALGLTVLLGYTGQISMAQATFYGIGAYAIALGTTRYHTNWWVALAIGIIAAAMFGTFLGMATLKLGGRYLAMITIGTQVIFSLIMLNWIKFSGGPDGISGIKRPPFFFDVKTAHDYSWLALGLLFIVGVFVWWLRNTRLGRSMVAVRENELAAEAMGVDTVRTKVIAFVISAILGAIGGAIYAAGFAYISPDTFSYDMSIQTLAATLLGGSDAVVGTILGAGALTFLPELLRDFKSIYLVIYGFIIIGVIVFMPNGLWGFVDLAAKRLVKRPTMAKAETELPVGGQGQQGEELLVVTGLGKHFGGLKALDGVDFVVRRGELHALIGPNGSGKSTSINVISGIYVPTFGSVKFKGAEIGGKRASKIAQSGMARTFQNLRLFRELTVWENVLIGAQKKGGSAAAVVDRARAAIEFVGMSGTAFEQCKNLPYGHQKLVEIARQLAGEPELLLLDEPAAGLNQTEKQEMVLLLKRLHNAGLTMLLVEHDMSMVAQLSDTMTVLNFGKKISEGNPDHVLSAPAVVEAYLGNREVALNA